MENKSYQCSVEEWNQHRGEYDGLCLDCGEWTSGGVEPDAENYECPSCGAHNVQGAEVVLFDLDFAEDQQ